MSATTILHVEHRRATVSVNLAALFGLREVGCVK
jgi:hypothetical protein